MLYVMKTLNTITIAGTLCLGTPYSIWHELCFSEIYRSKWQWV